MGHRTPSQYASGKWRFLFWEILLTVGWGSIPIDRSLTYWKKSECNAILAGYTLLNPTLLFFATHDFLLRNSIVWYKEPKFGDVSSSLVPFDSTNDHLKLGKHLETKTTWLWKSHVVNSHLFGDTDQQFSCWAGCPGFFEDCALWLLSVSVGHSWVRVIYVL